VLTRCGPWLSLSVWPQVHGQVQRTSILVSQIRVSEFVNPKLLRLHMHDKSHGHSCFTRFLRAAAGSTSSRPPIVHISKSGHTNMVSEHRDPRDPSNPMTQTDQIKSKSNQIRSDILRRINARFAISIPYTGTESPFSVSFTSSPSSASPF
jgi:hypothetical protein